MDLKELKKKEVLSSEESDLIEGPLNSLRLFEKKEYREDSIQGLNGKRTLKYEKIHERYSDVEIRVKDEKRDEVFNSIAKALEGNRKNEVKGARLGGDLMKEKIDEINQLNESVNGTNLLNWLSSNWVFLAGGVVVALAVVFLVKNQRLMSNDVKNLNKSVVELKDAVKSLSIENNLLKGGTLNKDGLELIRLKEENMLLKKQEMYFKNSLGIAGQLALMGTGAWLLKKLF